MQRNKTKSDPLDGHTTSFPVTVNLPQALLAGLGVTEHNLDDLINNLIEDGLRARRGESAMTVALQEIAQDLKRLTERREQFEEIKQDLKSLLELQIQQDQKLQRLENCCGLIAASLSWILETNIDVLLTALSAVSQPFPERTSGIDLLLKEINGKRVRSH